MRCPCQVGCLVGEMPFIEFLGSYQLEPSTRGRIASRGVKRSFIRIRNEVYSHVSSMRRGGRHYGSKTDYIA